MLEINEPVNVWVLFKGNSIEPWCFFWKKRQIKVDKINLVHTTKQGNSIKYHFSVSSGGNFYELAMQLPGCAWHLLALEDEP